jgi:hypothetical protein
MFVFPFTGIHCISALRGEKAGLRFSGKAGE